VFGQLAVGFHFQPSELWAMTADDLEFWVRQLNRISEEASDGT
jgi:hypothetical protein